MADMPPPPCDVLTPLSLKRCQERATISNTAVVATNHPANGNYYRPSIVIELAMMKLMELLFIATRMPSASQHVLLAALEAFIIEGSFVVDHNCPGA